MYKLYLENDPDMIELCTLYCHAKNYFWNLFFGWRKTNHHGCYFKFTEKQHDAILKSANFLVGYKVL